ncbi:Ig-like domain-containing protein [Aliirhizobium terrae]|uniref:Ig-like domain-containing protein n=1 Tax=Terrirhizobium terrae TaxID=2926709 RepID=UPI00257785CA|nr:Ig-like domain-containing protein [Rhizobium sp. CC-CFT758]WJH41457.1 Ig-like domain-containing protein [Rhizobium sp. CC-CFT758]
MRTQPSHSTYGPTISDVDGDPLTVTRINGTAISSGGSVAVTGGTVTLNANGTLTFTPAANYNGSPTFTYTISDGQGGTATATVNGTVSPVQDPPVAGNDAFTTAEDTPTTISVLGNDSDPDGDALTITAVNGTAITSGATVSVTGGAVTLNANGTLTFTPTANYNGSPSFTYTISDGNGGTATATVNGTVTPINDAPVAGNDTFTTAEDTAVNINVRANDSDVDGDTLTITQINGTAIVSGATVSVTGGTVTLNANGTLTFTPAANYNGSPSFTYTVSDGNGGTATATVNGTVTPVNDAPVATNDTFTTPEDTAITIDVRANDSDVDGDALTVTAINGTAIATGQSIAITGGYIRLDADGRLSFTPNANFNGAVSFSYTVSDGNGGTATATVNGTVTAVNDAPVSSNVSISTAEDTPFSGTLSATDVDGDTITFAAGTTTPANGSVTINANGTYTYTPNANYNGSDTFSFVVTDPNGGRNEYTVTVTVTGENDAPVGTPLPNRTANDGASVNFDVSSFFSDADNDTLTYAQTGLPSGLSITAAGVITGTIDNQASQGGVNGVYTVTVTVSDGNGGTAQQTFTLTVSNPAPIAVNDTATTAEDTAVTINVLANDSDPDGDPLTITSATAAHGSVTILANGQISYLPSANYNGTDTITYTISDGNGGTATGTVTVTVTPVNDDPVGSPIADRTRNDGDTDSLDLSAFFSDPEGGALTYTVEGLPAGLTLSGSTISGDIAADASGPTGERVYTVRVTASDGAGGTAVITFSYTVLNIPPVANDDAVTTNEDTPVDIDILDNDTDPDGDAAEVIRVNNQVLTPNGAAVETTHGSVRLIENPDGSQFLRFTPDADYNGQESFSYTIDDGNGGLDTATVTVTVLPVNDTPTPTQPIPDRVRADGQSFTYDVADFFTDPDGDDLTFTITGLPAGLSYNAATGLIFGNIDRNASQGGNNGVYTITITATDGTTSTPAQTFELTVTNPGPTANNDTATVNEDTSITINPLANDTDPDGDTLTITAASAGNGSVTINADGTITYVPQLNFNGVDTIVYTISDGDGGVSTATIRVTVTPVNDNPTSDPIPDQYDSDGQTVSYDVSPYFDDIDGEALSFTAQGLPPGLSMDAAGRITGTLAANASNTDPYTVEITASDGNGGTTIRTITWYVTNLPPKAFNDTLTLGENASGSGNVLSNDQDPDNDPLSVDQVEGASVNVGVAVEGSNGGTFVINANGTYTFNPGTDFDDMSVGDPPRTTTITYRVTDGTNVDTATITVTINGVNDAPTADTIPNYTRADGQSLTDHPLHLGAFFQDIDANDTLTFTQNGLPQGLTMAADGTITGEIANDASQGGPEGDGVYTVTITASDGRGGTVIQTFSFTVTNPAPTAGNDTVVTGEDEPVTFDPITGDGTTSGALGADTDPDGDTLSIDPDFAPVAGNGTVVVNPDGTLTYTPNANYNGTDTIVYRVTDDQGGVSTGIITVSVDAENDPPISSPIADVERNDGETISFDVSGNFVDPEGEPLTYTATGLPPGLSIDPETGVISGRIDPGASGPNGISSFVVTITATDPDEGSVSETFTYTIRNVAPNAENDAVTTNEDTPVDIDILANDTDGDGDTDTVIRVEGVNLTIGGPAVMTANGSVQLVLNAAGREVLRFTPNANFNGTESFAYTIGDGNGGTDSATVTVTVTPVNDAPVATPIPDRTQVDGSAFSLDVRPYFSDVDGQTLTYTVGALPPGLTFDPATGLISGTLDASASQGSPYTITVTASDGTASVSDSFVFTVTNPAPGAANDTVDATEDTPVTFNPITGEGTASGDAGEDIDPDGDPLTITQIDGQAIAVGQTIAVAGGSVTLADADGNLTFTPTLNFNGTVGFTYRVSDGNGGFSDASVTLNIAAVNDVPVVDLNGTATGGTGNQVSFIEGDAPVQIVTPDAIVSDIEGGVVSLDVNLAGFADGGSEIIHLNGAVDIIVGTASSGTIAFGGTTFFYSYNGSNALHFENAAGPSVPMPDAAASALLRALQYENRDDNLTAGDRTLTISVTDNQNATTQAVATVSVGAVNDPPVAVNDNATTGENTPITSGPSVLGNDSDAEGTTLTVIAVGAGNPGDAIDGSDGGSFVIAADGTYTFDPGTEFDDLQVGESRTTSVTYTISDGQGGTATATLTITVTGENDAPVGGDFTLDATEDTTATGFLPVTDIDGGPLTYAVTGQPANGTITIGTDGSYTYVPAANFSGADSFTYTVNDGRTTVTFTVTVNVENVEDPPVGEIPNQTYDDAEDVSLDVSQFFTDADGDTLTFSQTGLPEGLTMAADGTITGTLESDASQVAGGVYVVTVTVSDGQTGGTITRDFTITVSNPAPVAQNDAITTGENTPATGSVFANNGSGTDSDPDGDTITVSAVNGNASGVGTSIIGTAGGSFTIAAGGGYTFNPGTDFDDLAAGESRTTSVTYTISDGQGGTSTATFTVTVTGANDAPIGADATIDVTEDTPFSGTLPVATDAEGQPLTYAAGSQPDNGRVVVNADGTYTYTPDPNFNGEDSFTYTVSDGTATVTYTITVNVGAVNDAPVLGNDTFTLDEDDSTTIDVLANDSDADNDPLTITAIDGQAIGVGGTVPVTGGTITLNADGTLTFAAAANFNGPLTFTYTVSDGTTTSTATVSGQVDAVNDTPVAVDDAATTDENTAIEGNVIIGSDSDPDGDTLTVIEVGAGPNGVGATLAGSNGGSFVILADGSYSFDPGAAFQDLQAGESRTTSIAYTISDGNGGTATATLTVTVTGVNDAPTAPTLPPRSNIDGATINLDLGSQFSDIDGDTLSYTVTGLPTGLTYDPAAGAITGTIDPSASGPTGTFAFTVTMTASDGNGGSVERSFTWTVTNPVPVAQDDTFAIDEGDTLEGNVLANNGNGADADEDPLTVSLVNGPANGTLTLNADGTFTYQPNAFFNGTDSFTYQVDDGNGGVNTATVTINIGAVNDPPVPADDTFAIDEDGSAVIDVLGNDSDPDNDTLTVTAINGQAISAGNPVSVTGGSVSLNADGTLTFTAAANYNGSPSFSYTVSDDTVSRDAIVSGIVRAINDAPVNTLPGSFAGSEDTDLALTGIQITDVDAGNAPVTVTLGVDAGSLIAFSGGGVTVAGSGSASITLTGSVANINAWLAGPTAPVYRPVANSSAAVALTMTTDDGGNSGAGGALSATSTASILIDPVNDAPVATDQLISTPEDTPIAGTIAASDVDGDPLTYVVTSQPANGRVTIDASGAYLYTPNTDFNGTDSFTVTISDGQGGTTTATVTIDVSPVNDAPIGSDGAITVMEDVPFTGQLPAATDPEGSPITYAVGSQPAHGTVTVNADGSYSYSPAANYNGADSFTFTVSDGTATTTYTIAITVTAVNDAPVGSNTSISINEDTPFTGQLPTATDAESDAITYALATTAANGTVTVNADGSYSYTPNANFNGTDSFTYTVSDGAASNTYTVTINVGAVNDAPIADDLAVTIDEDTPIVNGTLPEATDAEGDDITYALGNSPLNGSVTVNPDGTYSYTPNANFNGTDTFTYTVSDGAASNTYTVTITVDPVNDAPVAPNASISVTEDVPFNGNLPTATDVEGDDVVYAVADQATNGTVSINPDGSYTYTPNGNYNGPDSFTYTVSDGVDSNTYTVTISVGAVNDAPVASDASVTIDEDTSITNAALPAATDADGDTVSYALRSQAAHGTVVVNGNGTYSYVPNANFNGTDTFTYTVSDGTASNTYTVTITVNPINDAPVASNTSISVTEDVPFTGNLPTATDAEGDDVVYSIAGQATNGTVSINPDGSYTYTPNANYNGPDSFSYTVSDGIDSNTYTVTISVGAVNDAPVASDTSVTIDEDTAITNGTLPAATDADGNTISYALGSQAANGTVVVNGNGTYSYVPNANFNGTDTFTYTVSDGTATATYTVTITVNPINDAPVASDTPISVTEDTPLDGQLPPATDVENDDISYALGTGPANGTVVVNADGSYTYTPDADYNGPDSFTYTVSDGVSFNTYTVTVTVGPENDAPIADNATTTTDEDTPITNGVLPVATDPEGSPVTYGLGRDALNGSVTVNEDGTYSYVPDANFNGTDSFTYTVTDGTATSTYTVTITVNAINDAPVAADAAISVTEDTPFAGDLPRATDVEGNDVTYALGTGPTNGTIVVNADGSYTYTPNADYNGPDSFTYTVSDGVDSNIYTVTISVGAVNDAPIADNATATTDEDTPITNGVLPAATDPEGSPVTYGLGRDTLNGTVTVNANGTYSYVPDANFNGTDGFTYTVSDGTATSTYTVTITVNAVNDAPVASDTAISVTEDTPFAGSLPQATDVEGDDVTYVLGDGPSNGTLVLNADGTYAYTPNANFNGTDSFTYTVTDGAGTSAVYTVAITVTPVNDAPVGSGDAITVTEDVPFDGQLPAATDADGDDLDYALGSAATNGTVTVNADGSYRYVPNANFNGSDSFTYTVSDGVATSTYTVTITVTAVDDAPIGSDGAITVTEDVPFNGALPAATDPEGNPVSYSLETAPANGTIVLNEDGTYTYTPNANFNGSDVFTYTVSDGAETSTYTISITVNAVNDAPVGSNDAITVVEDTPFDGELPPASDAENDPLTYELGTQAVNGTVTVNADGIYRYVPNPNFSGSDSFTYTVSDGLASSTYTVTINVTEVNDAPIGSDTSISVTEDVPANGTLPRATDPEGQPLTYGLGTTLPAHGTVTVNADGTYTYTPAANYNGTDTFTYTVTDGTATSTYTVTVTVGAVNDAPVGSNDAVSTDEDTAYNGQLPTATDADGDALTYAKASDPANGTLTVNANGSYAYVPNANFNGTDSFTYTVSDGIATRSYTVTVTVNAVNDAPSGSDGAISTDEDTPFTGQLPTATDQDGDPLSYRLATQAENGAVSINLDGSYTYTPNADFNGTDSFTYTVSDGRIERTYTITVTVGAENDPPVGEDLDIAIDEDGTAAGQLPQATDPDGDPLTYGLGTQAGNGTATVNEDGSYTYVPNANFNGTDTFTYTVTDGTVTVSYTVTITVNAVNDPPTGADDAITTAEDTPFEGVLPVATDPDGDTLRYSLAVQAGNGIVAINADGSYSYTPDANFNGTDAFTYAVSDGTVIRTYTVTVTVTPENDAPVGRDDAVETNEDTAYDGQLPAATDVDGETLTYGLGEQAANGTVTVNTDGSYTYVPDANFNGTDSFDYTVTDGTTTVTYTVTITVGAVNDPPVGQDDAVATDEDTAFDGQLPTATDADGDALVYGKGRDPENGTVTVNEDGSYTYTPNAVFNGSDSFTYTVSDGASTSTYTVTITVRPVNDAPVGRNDAVSTAEDTPLDGQLPVATDVDGDTLTYGLGEQAENGTVTVNADGSYSYVPNADFAGTDTFTYTVTDGTETVSYTVTVTVGAVNDPPVGQDDDILTDEDVTFEGQLPTATDADGDPLTYAVGSQPLHGTVTVNADGSYTYQPAANYNGADSFTYTVSDGTATATYTVNITIDPVNDAPVGSDLEISVENDGTATGTLPPATDPEGSPVSYALGTVTPGALVTVNADGIYSYTPPPGFSGPDTFTYTVSDGDETSTYTVTVNVGPANQPPTADDDTVDAIEDEPLSGELPVATDPEGSPVTYALGRDAINGSVIVNADGTYTYTPNPNFSGTDSFTYSVSDGSASSVYTITINVAEVNDAPVGSDISISVTEDVPASGTLPPATDPEGQPVTYGLGTTLPEHGSVVVNTDGTYTYTPNANFNGADSFTYIVSDGAATVSYTVTVTVGAVNDPPVGQDGTASAIEDTPLKASCPPQPTPTATNSSTPRAAIRRTAR